MPVSRFIALRRSLLLIPLWMRIKSLMYAVLTKKPTLKHFHKLLGIINDYISLTRKPISKSPESESKSKTVSPNTKSSSGVPTGAPRANNIKPKSYRRS